MTWSRVIAAVGAAGAGVVLLIFAPSQQQLGSGLIGAALGLFVATPVQAARQLRGKR